MDWKRLLEHCASIEPFRTSEASEEPIDRYSVAAWNQPEKTAFHRSEAAAEELTDRVRSVAADSFGVPVVDLPREATREHVRDVDCLSVLYNADSMEVLGFASAFILSDIELFYLHGVAVVRAFHARGAGRALVKPLLEFNPKPRIGLTTQNPVMFYSARKWCNAIYPSPEQNSVPKVLASLAKHLVGADKIGALDSDTFIFKPLYDRCLYSQIPESKDPVVNRWFNESLAINENRTTCNGFLFIGTGLRL